MLFHELLDLLELLSQCRIKPLQVRQFRLNLNYLLLLLGHLRPQGSIFCFDLFQLGAGGMKLISEPHVLVTESHLVRHAIVERSIVMVELRVLSTNIGISRTKLLVFLE